MKSEGVLSSGGSSARRPCGDPQVRVGLVSGACLLIEAVIAKNVIDVELDVFSQFAALWIFIAYQLGGRRDRTSELAFIVAMILATVAVLVVYAI